jgi:CheY-like chemotaxis protein
MRLEEATILVVDDEPDLREIFSAWLQHEGCLVFTATNGAEALEVLAAHRIDAMVSDIRMPVMDGVALVRTIFERKLPIPIILVSGFGNVEPTEMYRLGVKALMEKPLRRQDLLCVLENGLMEGEHGRLIRPA